MRAGDEIATSSDRKFGGTRWGMTMMTYGGLVEKDLCWALQVSNGHYRPFISSVFGQQSSAQIDQRQGNRIQYIQVYTAVFILKYIEKYY